MQDLKRGILATALLVPGVVAFGLLYGVMARQVGFSPWEAWAMSIIVHAGSAQFVALGMWETAGAAAILLTTLAINLRHLLMGASVAAHLRGLSRPWKALLALWMSDESYALTIAEYEQDRGSHWYFLGANVGIYLAQPLIPSPAASTTAPARFQAALNSPVQSKCTSRPAMRGRTKYKSKAHSPPMTLSQFCVA
jgi:predicted branched-subunit amino acid permease